MCTFRVENRRKAAIPDARISGFRSETKAADPGWRIAPVRIMVRGDYRVMT